MEAYDTINLAEIDFLWQTSEQDDLMLSQVCDEIEMDHQLGEIHLQDVMEFIDLPNFDLSFDTKAQVINLQTLT